MLTLEELEEIEFTPKQTAKILAEMGLIGGSPLVWLNWAKNEFKSLAPSGRPIRQGIAKLDKRARRLKARYRFEDICALALCRSLSLGRPEHKRRAKSRLRIQKIGIMVEELDDLAKQMRKQVARYLNNEIRLNLCYESNFGKLSFIVLEVDPNPIIFEAHEIIDKLSKSEF